MMKRGADCSEVKMLLHLGVRLWSVKTEIILVAADFFEEGDMELTREQENIFDDVVQ